jgi:hypothetical protein
MYYAYFCFKHIFFEEWMRYSKDFRCMDSHVMDVATLQSVPQKHSPCSFTKLRIGYHVCKYGVSNENIMTMLLKYYHTDRQSFEYMNIQIC